MNARELLDDLEAMNPLTFDDDERKRYEITHAALSLLAAAQDNDGSTPETDYVERATGEIYPLARRMERERRGLAREVLRLREDAERKIGRGCYCLVQMMQAYERRIRSQCSPEELEKRPWECMEYVAAADYLKAIWPKYAAIDAARNAKGGGE